MSDRIAIMDHGKIIQVGTPAEIYEHPLTRFVASFIGDTNLLSGQVLGPMDDRRLAVRAAGATIVAQAHGSMTSGQPVWLSVRCERIRIGDRLSPAPDGNIYSGQVAEMIYVGSVLKYEVRTAEGLTLKVHVANTRDQSIWPAGSSVQIGWEPEHAVVLSA